MATAMPKPCKKFSKRMPLNETFLKHSELFGVSSSNCLSGLGCGNAALDLQASKLILHKLY
jgi:hypothetical protein